MTPHSTRPSTLIATARTALALAAAALLISGCAGLGTPKTPEEQVAKRAQERLDFMIKWDLEKALRYTTPAFRQRSNTTDYSRRHAGMRNWADAKVDSVDCQQTYCDVTVLATYPTPRLGANVTNTRTLEERWVQIDNQWYIYHR